jgi:hypothetical protein
VIDPTVYRETRRNGPNDRFLGDLVRSFQRIAWMVYSFGRESRTHQTVRRKQIGSPWTPVAFFDATKGCRSTGGTRQRAHRLQSHFRGHSAHLAPTRSSQPLLTDRRQDHDRTRRKSRQNKNRTGQDRTGQEAHDADALYRCEVKVVCTTDSVLASSFRHLCG